MENTKCRANFRFLLASEMKEAADGSDGTDGIGWKRSALDRGLLPETGIGVRVGRLEPRANEGFGFAGDRYASSRWTSGTGDL